MLTDGTTARWGRRRSGGLTGLQNQLARLNPGLVGSIPTRSRHRVLALVLALALMGATHVSELQGQQPLAGPSRDLTDDIGSQETPGRVSPGGALVRSFLVPGWGQAVAGSPRRGAFYFTFESLSLWMVLKTSHTLGSARDIVALRRLEAEERLSTSGTVDPVELLAAIDRDQAVTDAENLEQIRLQQREDWLSFGLFLLLLGGADAFVAAHLAEFPEPLEVAIRPLPNMGVELGFSLTF